MCVTPSTILNAQVLLSEVEALRQHHIGSSWNEFLEQFSKLKSQVIEQRRQARDLAAATAEPLNIFELLRVELLEAYHTRFLAALLDVRGDHGQQSLFLDIFADAVLPGPIRDAIRSTGDITTYSEYPTYFGRLDILISSPSNRFVVVIENKIGAKDSPDQLERYCRWLDTNKRVQPNARVLLFLTPEGLLSTDKADGYLPISYKHHIRDWMMASLSGALPAKLRSLIEQYTTTIAKICNDQVSYEGISRQDM